MNKKGFTLVELIATIGIMLIIVGIVVPNVIKTIDQNRTKLYKNQETRLEDAAIKYLTEIDTTSINTVTITKNNLISAGYISEIKDIKDSSQICNGYVIVTNLQTTSQVQGYISCQNYTTTGYDASNLS